MQQRHVKADCQVSRRCRANRLRHRHGFLTIELALTLPLLLLLLLAIFEFALLLLATSQLHDASRVGARAASLPGVDQVAAEQEVRRVLNGRLSQRLRVEIETSRRSGDVVACQLAVPMTDAAPDLLWPVGFSLQGRELFAQSRMIKE